MRALTGTQALLVCLLATACGQGEPPSTGVDLDTPVTELAGWNSMVTELELPAGRQAVLARWVDTFRTGLDVVRHEQELRAREEHEESWWLEAERSLGALLSPDAVLRVTTWLEGRFGRRGGER